MHAADPDQGDSLSISGVSIVSLYGTIKDNHNGTRTFTPAVDGHTTPDPLDMLLASIRDFATALIASDPMYTA